jgi:hypothetical protein
MTYALTAADRLEIKDPLTMWAINEDTGQSEAWANLFTADGRCTNGRGETIVGHEALARNSRERWANPESRVVVHSMGDPLITATDGRSRDALLYDDRAKSRWPASAELVRADVRLPERKRPLANSGAGYQHAAARITRARCGKGKHYVDQTNCYLHGFAGQRR